jgi:transposase InsO family protein
VHARSQHPNAVLTPEGRRRMVSLVLDDGWSVEATAERFQVDAKTVRKWRDRFVAEGSEGLRDRSCRPRSCPWSTPQALRDQILDLRARRRWGAAHIAHEIGRSASSVQKVLNAAGVGRLDHGDRATEPPRRYERQRPGELVHVDVKKLAAIPAGGGWKSRGRGAANGLGRHGGAGYRYLHSAIDDRTRLVYSEILDDEQARTAAGFWGRAVAFFAGHGLVIERAITDNGACYRSNAWRAALAATGASARRTRPYRPQTNGKIERFHRILLEEWAYIRPWTSETERHHGYAHFCHFYNHHRSHGSLGWATPAATLARFGGDNVSGLHS